MTVSTTTASLFAPLYTDTVNVRTVQELMVSILGLGVLTDTAATYGGASSRDILNGTTQPCFTNCTYTAQCSKEICLCPCSHEVNFGAAFASISYLLLLIATVQLVLVMVYDSLQDDKQESSRLQKAFRMTLQKCLLGAVIMATGSRAIYYTLISFIPVKWADIILNLYYPALLTAFSLLICFWAEFFYTSKPADGCGFLRKHKYTVSLLIFNLVVYLLLVADIIATPLISDHEQVQMSGVISTIFAVLFFVILVGFLHYAIRLFFRPDWQPLFVQLQELHINLKQQAASVLGIVSNAVMQGLIISILLLNMVGRFQPVDSYSLYICAIVIRVTELIMPLWFCCSLWNYKQPKRLWILNPGLVVKLDQIIGNSESDPLLATKSDTSSVYGATSLNSAESRSLLEDSSEEGCCWVCQGVIEDPGDLFYPCNCKLHKKCIKQWVVKRASNANIPEKEYLKCQVCRKRYRVQRYSCLCLFKGLQRKHWLQLLGGLLIIAVSVGGCVYTGLYTSLSSTTKIIIISSVTVIDVVFFKLIGFGMVRLYRKNKYKIMDIQGLSVDQWREKQRSRQARKTRASHSRTNSMTGSVHYSSTGDSVVIKMDNSLNQK